MSFRNLHQFIQALEEKKELIRIGDEVDSNQEITILQHIVQSNNGPALLFENIKGSSFPLVTNMYGTPERVEIAFGRHPAETGEILVRAAHELMPPSVQRMWTARADIMKLCFARMRRVRSGPILSLVTDIPQLTKLPCLKCWPEDGGPFFTLPLVHTIDPDNGAGNLGIYRMQRYDDTSTGMHWQIEKGGGFHFDKAIRKGEDLPVSVILGGPPALTMAAIAPLPEGIDERVLAALIMGAPLDVIKRQGTGHCIPAEAEFVLEGSVTAGDVHKEGPFGDHLGHYSHSAMFPVFRVKRMLARKGAVYPATVVGKPPQEDFYIGNALQEMTLPILRFMHQGILDLWAYPETGFHPLAVASVRERYPREALKYAFAVLGQGQLSLTKVLIVTGPECNDVRDFSKVSDTIFRYLDPEEGMHLISPTAQDTLDFTGPSMNTGSRLVLIATKGKKPPRDRIPKAPPRPDSVHTGITAMTTIGPAFLMVQVAETADKKSVMDALRKNEITSEYMFHVLVSADVPVDSRMMLLWGWFTRFDPQSDIHPSGTSVSGNKLTMKFPVAIDATWKAGYRKPVAFDPDIEARVKKLADKLGLAG